MNSLTRLHDSIEEFRDAFERTPKVWDQIDFRVLAVRLEDRYVNIMTRCELVDAAHAVSPVEIRESYLEPFICLHRFLPLSDVDFILNGIEKGEIALPDIQIKYLRRESDSDRESALYDGSYSFQTAELGYYFRDENQISNKGTLSFSATGASLHDVLGQTRVAVDRIDRALRTLPEPIDGLNVLSRFVCGRSLIGMSYSASFELAAPIAVMFDRRRCTFRRSHIEIAIVAPSQSLAKSTGLAITWSDSRRRPASKSFVLEGWENIDGAFQTQFETQLPEAQTVTLLLRVGEHCVDRLELNDHVRGDGSIYVQAYMAFDPELRGLQDSILRSKLNSAEFEYAVPRLLSLCGLQLIPLAGSKRVSDATDGVAFVPYSNIVLALECTTATIDNKGKLGKLKARAVELQEAIPTFRVVPVIATALLREAISFGELKRAGAESTAVLSQEDLITLIQLAEANAAPLDVAEFIESRVPARETPSGYPR